MNRATVYAKTKHMKTSVKKVKPVMDLVRGLDVADAQRILKFDKTKASDIVLKTLRSAIANAKNNLNLNEDDLVITDIYATEGSTRKSGRFKGRGRFAKIFKRTAHIIVGLSERKVVK